jgi:hypothetical protein
MRLDTVRVKPSTRTVSIFSSQLPVPESANTNCAAYIGKVSEALQNLMMQHADIGTFLKHYLHRRVMADTAAIIRGLDPQESVMRSACNMSRWVDPDRP